MYIIKSQRKSDACEDYVIFGINNSKSLEKNF